VVRNAATRGGTPIPSEGIAVCQRAGNLLFRDSYWEAIKITVAEDSTQYSDHDKELRSIMHGVWSRVFPGGRATPSQLDAFLRGKLSVIPMSARASRNVGRLVSRDFQPLRLTAAEAKEVRNVSSSWAYYTGLPLMCESSNGVFHSLP
jgi:hypothetical protein